MKDRFRNRTIFGLNLIILFYLVFYSLSSNQSASSSKEPSLTVKQLNELLPDIDAWPNGSTEYSHAGWKHLVAAAKYIQKCDPASVDKAISEYHYECSLDKGNVELNETNGNINQVLAKARLNFTNSERRIEYDGKVLLLMRIIFDLPERAPITQRVKYFAWSTYLGNDSNNKPVFMDENRDGTINIGWPVSWNDGNPQLVSGETSLQGVVNVYDVLAEYRYFRAKYPFRDLSSFK